MLVLNHILPLLSFSWIFKLFSGDTELHQKLLAWTVLIFEIDFSLTLLCYSFMVKHLILLVGLKPKQVWESACFFYLPTATHNQMGSKPTKLGLIPYEFWNSLCDDIFLGWYFWIHFHIATWFLITMCRYDNTIDVFL